LYMREEKYITRGETRCAIIVRSGLCAGEIAEENIRNILISCVIVLVVCVVYVHTYNIITQAGKNVFGERESDKAIFSHSHERERMLRPLSTSPLHC
jgi:hypothetical protein